MQTPIREVTRVGRICLRRQAGAALGNLVIILSTWGALGASVTTDKPDYQPGETVLISGNGFGSTDVVTVQVLHVGGTNDNNTSPAHQPWQISAVNGKFDTSWLVPTNQDELGATLQVNATGSPSGRSATTYFTDAAPPLGRALISPPTGGFDIDGDLLANTPFSGVGDWVPGPSGTGGAVLSLAGVPVNPNTTFHLVDVYNSGTDNNFGGGNKVDDNPNTATSLKWGWVNNPVGNKVDMNHALIHFARDTSNHQWLVLAGDRLSDSGDAYIDFEFLQNTLSMTTNAGGTTGGFASAGPNCGRTTNDFILTIALTKGGKSAGLFLERWQATNSQTCGFDYVDVNLSTLPTNSVIGAVNTNTIVVPYGAFGGTNYAPNTFAEVAVDITALIAAEFDPCTSLALKTLMVKTKVSQSPSATIVDFIAPLQLGLRLGVFADAGPNQAKCTSGPSTTFTLNGTAQPGVFPFVSTNWSVVSGSATIDATNSLTTDVHVTSGSATLRLTLKDQSGCTKTSDVVLTVNPVPTCSISGPVVVCLNSSPTYSYAGPAGNNSFLWSISGNGTLSGATTGSSVVVNAGNLCNQPFTLTLTVTANGCSNTCSQPFLVNDTTPPVITCPPDKVLACGDSSDPGNTGSATATDNCGQPVTLTHSDAPTAANCTGNPGIDRTWMAEDACHNVATCVQHITFGDTTPPVITCPLDKVLACGDSTDPSNTGSATATDNCGQPVTITHTDALSAANCTGQAGIDRTWKAEDACHNVATCIQHITFADTTPPVITCPLDKVLACGDSTDPSNTGVATATDNCGQPVTITHTDAPTAADCAGNAGIDRTWKAEDGCHNAATCVQHITFADTTPPVITCPLDRLLECGDSTDPGNTGSATATDNCGQPVTITHSDAPTAANCTGQAGIDRTWMAEDACHNVATCVQHLTFADLTPPVISCPRDKVLECGDSTDPSNTGSATATDNCGQPVTITHNDVPTDANCTGQAGIDRTWKAEDACHNVATCVQHITFADTTPPVITCPLDKVLACGDSTDPANTGRATATDNCGQPVTITHTDEATEANCTGTAGIDRTWKAEDACHNVATCVQHITFADTTPPVITCPLDKVLACGDSTDPSNTGLATATDNCGQPVAITHTDAPTEANCTGSAGIDRTWKAEDACHNVATCVQHITFEDTTPPVITCPLDKFLACGESTDPSNTGVATATDNCGQPVSITHTDAPTAANCTGSPGIDRTWKAEDACHNVATCVQHITFANIAIPVITCPADKILACGDSTDPSNTGSATATNNCGQPVTITYSDTLTEANCTGSAGIDRTWKAEDACHNVASCVQHITFADTTPPVITCPLDKVLACGDSTDPSNTGVATAIDNCGQPVTITHTDAATEASCTGNAGIDRTWKAEDACHNVATCVQHITFADTTPPVITCPLDKVLTCGDSTDPSNTGVATAIDNCGQPVTITHTDAATEASCTGNAGIDRTWKAEDACHNVATCVQHITFADTTPPVITCPLDKVLACGDSTDPSNTGVATAIDNCGQPVTITHRDAATEASCTGNTGIDRTWKAEDACHNVATCVQHITFADTTPPLITCPLDKVLACGDSTDPSNTGSATATDNCGQPVTITHTDGPTAANCTGNTGIDRTWRAEDACHNVATCVQHITFADTTAPVIACPQDKVLACGDSAEPANTGSATATDNCGQPVTITHTDAATDATCTGKPGIDRTWRAEDACHNVATCVQHITFADTTPPMLTCPPDSILECGDSTDPSTTGSATATDNCGQPVAITHSDAPTAANCTGKPGINRTWRAEDACHNVARCVQHITFEDNTLPELVGVPADAVVACGAPIPGPCNAQAVTATDNCDPNPTVTCHQDISAHIGVERYYVTNCWTATDACSNRVSACQVITVQACGGASICVSKFYDKTADGLQNFGEVTIAGWKFTLTGPNGVNLMGYTGSNGQFCFANLPAGTYTVTEATPVQSNWLNTTPKTVQVILQDTGKAAKFGNVALGAGGGDGTPGFWSSKNGEAVMNDAPNGASPELALLSSLCLRTSSGGGFDPKSYQDLRTWLKNSTGVNAANVLSVQLASAELNVEAGRVSGNALIYAPGTVSANALGFATLYAVMNEANQLLCKYGSILSGDPSRNYATALKNALNNANNVSNFVLPNPAPFSF